ncbi:hypothetical protein FOZ63_027946, partial [Perkinsus olseni]
RDGGLLHSDTLGGFDPNHVLAIDPDAPKEKAVIGEVKWKLPKDIPECILSRMKKSREDAVVAYISSEWVIPSWHRQHVLAARLRSEMLFRALVKVRAKVPNIMAAYVLVDRNNAFVIQHYEKSNFTSVGYCDWWSKQYRVYAYFYDNLP